MADVRLLERLSKIPENFVLSGARRGDGSAQLSFDAGQEVIVLVQNEAYPCIITVETVIRCRERTWWSVFSWPSKEVVFDKVLASGSTTLAPFMDVAYRDTWFGSESGHHWLFRITAKPAVFVRGDLKGNHRTGPASFIAQWWLPKNPPAVVTPLP